MKMSVAEKGYVGFSFATLLGVNNEVVSLTVIPEKLDMINNHISTVKDVYMEKHFKEKNLKAIFDYKETSKDTKFVINSTSTNYVGEKKFFDTSSIEDIIAPSIKSLQKVNNGGGLQLNQFEKIKNSVLKSLRGETL